MTDPRDNSGEPDYRSRSGYRGEPQLEQSGGGGRSVILWIFAIIIVVGLAGHFLHAW